MRTTGNGCLENKNFSSVTKMETNSYQIQNTHYAFMTNYGKEPVGMPDFP